MSRIEGQRPPDAGIPGLSPLPPLEQTHKIQQQPDVTAIRKDAVNVSSRAKALNRIAAAVDVVPEIRAEKVAGIKQAIDAGTYDIKSADIADALIRDRLRDEVR